MNTNPAPGVLRFTYQEQADALTGARVVRLTPPGVPCLRNYFYQKSFTEDGEHLIIGCSAAGPMNLWDLELGTGLARRLTRGTGENIQGAYLSADDRFVFFTRGARDHVRVDRGSGKEDVVYTVPKPWVGYGTWNPNDTTTKVLGLVMHRDDRLPGPGGWEKFAAQFHLRPRMRLIEVDLVHGGARVVWEERRYLGHPLYRPGSDLIGFCHEGPHDLVESRIWFLSADGTGLTPVKQQAPGEAVMHEFWVPDGSRMLYVSYTEGEQTRSIWAAVPQGEGEPVHNEKLMDMPPCAHLMGNRDGTRLVGDGAGQLGDLSDPAAHAFEPDPRIHLFDLRTLTHRPVCGHHSSWRVYDGNTQASHPHPSFTPDETRVLFASDRDGDLALYLADLPEPAE